MWVCEKRGISGLSISGKTGIADNKSSEILNFQFSVLFAAAGGLASPFGRGAQNLRFWAERALSVKNQRFLTAPPEGGARMDATR